jgi:hypothetical protein
MNMKEKELPLNAHFCPQAKDLAVIISKIASWKCAVINDKIYAHSLKREKS